MLNDDTSAGKNSSHCQSINFLVTLHYELCQWISTMLHEEEEALGLPILLKGMSTLKSRGWTLPNYFLNDLVSSSCLSAPLLPFLSLLPVRLHFAQVKLSWHTPNGRTITTLTTWNYPLPLTCCLVLFVRLLERWIGMDPRRAERKRIHAPATLTYSSPSPFMCHKHTKKDRATNIFAPFLL